MKHILTTILLISSGICSGQTQLTITIDTKLMYNVDCNLLGDGAGGPAQVNKVYMHSGACSENRGSNPSQSAEDYCLDQIVPYNSDVWQHVVGNWGANPQDDGVGEMANLGNGIYQIQLDVESYYSDSLLVNSNTVITQSTLLNPNNPVHVIGLAFRNEDGVASGRDQQGCNDIFLVNFDTQDPIILNSTDFSACEFVTIEMDTCTPVNLDVFGQTNIQPFTSYNYVIDPPPAEYTITWSEENGSIISGQGTNFVEIFWDASGWGEVIATLSSGTNCTVTDTLLVGSIPTGVSQHILEQTRISPNPSTGTFTVNVPDQSNFQASVFDALGKLVSTSSEMGSFNLDLSEVPVGIYTLRLDTEAGTVTKKLVRK